MRRIAIIVSLAYLLVACGQSSGIRTPRPAPTADPGAYDPAVTPTERPVPLVPPSPPYDPEFGKKLDPNFAHRLTLVKTELRRHGFPVAVEELKALGWYAIDLAAGKASWYEAGIGREDLNWGVPQPVIFENQAANVWINGTSTSIHGSSLNLQPWIAVVGFEARESTAFTQAVSEDGVPKDAPEVRVTPYVRANAIPGEEARVEYGLGWQSKDIYVTYVYRYDP